MKKKILTAILSIVIIAVALVSGYMVGSLIGDKKFVVDIYANLTSDKIVDDITKLNWENKTPDQLTPAEAFEVAEYVLTQQNTYNIIGNGTLDTSLGITQSSYTEDRKNGDDLYLAFVTYSTLIKVAKRCNYVVGGEIAMNDGKPNGKTTNDVTWTDKYERYTWEEYKETFGKYANKNCSYLVANNSVTESSFDGVVDGVYCFSVTLHPIYSTLSYARQIAMNMGVEPSNVTFSALKMSFKMDKDYKFIEQTKYEQYTLPYAGVNVTITGNINTVFTY